MNKLYLIALMLVLVVLAGCNGQTQPPAATEAVSLQFSWVHEYSSSMFHAAQKEGFFSANHLDVTLVEGGFGPDGFIDAISTVVDGGLEFGVTDAFRLIEARAEGIPVVALAAVLQRSPNAIISLPDTGIVRPQDLVGHSLTVAEGGGNLLTNSLLESQNIAAEGVTIVPRTNFGVDPLVNGEVDALMGWIINEGVLLEEAGLTPNYILFSDYGVENYNFVLFTTEDMIANHPDTVQNMVNSVIQGVEFIVSNPDKAIEHTLEYDSELDTDAQLRRLRAAIPLMNVPGVAVGSMSEEVWAFSADILKAQGTIDESFDVTSVYTLDFLGKLN